MKVNKLPKDCQPLFVNQIELPEVAAACAEKWKNGEFSPLANAFL